MKTFEGKTLFLLKKIRVATQLENNCHRIEIPCQIVWHWNYINTYILRRDRKDSISGREIWGMFFLLKTYFSLFKLIFFYFLLYIQIIHKIYGEIIFLVNFEIGEV